MGDLYLDVAEAFLDVGEYNSALPLLSALVCSERYNLAVVWLRHAGNASAVQETVSVSIPNTVHYNRISVPVVPASCSWNWSALRSSC